MRPPVSVHSEKEKEGEQTALKTVQVVPMFLSAYSPPSSWEDNIVAQSSRQLPACCPPSIVHASRGEDLALLPLRALGLQGGLLALEVGGECFELRVARLELALLCRQRRCLLVGRLRLGKWERTREHAM